MNAIDAAAVRKRPGMFVGDVHDGAGLEHMVWELVANALDQHLAGYARLVSVAIDPDGSVEVTDDGAGISLHEVADGRTYLEDMFAVMHATPTRDHHVPHVHLSPSLHGLGLFPVAALSSRLEIETVHRARRACLTLARGEVIHPIVIEPTHRRSGTRARFAPDVSIFGTGRVSATRIEARLRELAWFVPQLELRFRGEVLPGRGGLFELVRSLGAREPILATCREIDGARVALALGWSGADQTDRTAVIRSFVNYHPSLRGTHVTGLFEGLADLATARGHRVDAAEARERVSPGLRAVVHVGLLGAEFGAPTRDHLRSPTAGVVTRKALAEAHDALAEGRWQRTGGPPPSSPFCDELLRRLRREDR